VFRFENESVLFFGSKTIITEEKADNPLQLVSTAQNFDQQFFASNDHRLGSDQF
jgi:hypothetical protein